jgi:hypothetical protein
MVRVSFCRNVSIYIVRVRFGTRERHKQHTKRSSAVGDFLSGGGILLSVERKFCILLVVFGSRKGFRDTGRGAGSSKGEVGL